MGKIYPKISNGVNKTIIGIAAIALVLIGAMWAARPGGEDAPSGNNQNSGGAILAEETSFDFGAISMAGGNVSHAFKIKNTSQSATTIDKMYTSCMCTVATLVKGDKRFGPYGMPGHGFIPKMGEELAPGEEATVEVVFDPAAHGPAGVGKIERVVVIETGSGQPLQLQFAAVVTP